VKVSADVRGLDITPAIGGSRLIQVGVLSSGAGLPGSTGITVRDQRSGSGDLLVANTVLRGWMTGIFVDRGGQVGVINSRLLREGRPIVSDFGRVKLRQSVIEGQEFGGYFAGPPPQIARNRFYNAEPRFDVGVEPVLEPNYVYLPPTFCYYPLQPGFFCR